jgi:hypothetical protein
VSEEQQFDDLGPVQVEQVAGLEPKRDEGLVVEHREVLDAFEESRVAVVGQQ